jgi:hypothetical protein
MAHVESITMSMREIHELKVIQAVIDGSLNPMPAPLQPAIRRCCENNPSKIRGIV